VTAFISVRSVSFTYPKTKIPILSEIDLQVEPGATVGFTGPSGSGKSTLLALIGGVIVPSQGAIEIFGQDIWAAERSLREDLLRQVAWVVQSGNTVGGLTALENIVLGLLAQGASVSEAYSRAGSALRVVDLDHFSATPVKRLSGGQAQRVAVARALAVRAPIVLADEPTGQLDRAATASVTDTLLRCADNGQSLAIATHDPYVADQCSARFDLREGIATVC
jgi:ABC-type lipoprotein export system ATPase subunit